MQTTEKSCKSRSLRSTLLFSVLAAGLSVSASAFADSVLTYHNDNRRTGWDKHERELTPATVKNGTGGKHFKRLHSVTFDEQSDAQPLVVTNQTIKGKGVHDVVYVVTENNTVYAFDANNGDMLRKRHFGKPVPIDALPGGCNNNSNFVGIGSTPVIDPDSKTLYLIADIYDSDSNSGAFWLHAVDLASLDDVTPAVKVHASGKLTNNHTYRFDANVSRQRAALLLANGNVYAGFASYCDVAADQSRGWVLGWNKDTLKPLAANELTDKLASSTDNYFLTSVWMSGFGLASSAMNDGDIYFVTGNSDPSGDSIDKVNNVAESSVQLSSDLLNIKSVFTPDNAVGLEEGDGDFGSGGLTLLPPQPGAIPNLAVAAGKDGEMYLLNADNLHNHTHGSARILDEESIGSCWCGESYFTASDGTGRVISSGSNSIILWKVKTGSNPNLVNLHESDGIPGSQSGGFFTSVSSDGAKTHTAIVWAVSRPDGSPAEHVWLYAFNGTSAETVFSAKAGTWPNTGGDSNTVPTVANGKVYVASYKELDIFGFSGSAAEAPMANLGHVEPARAHLPQGEHEIFGMVRAFRGSIIVLARRDGALVTVDARDALRQARFAQPTVGHGVMVRGRYNGARTFVASYVFHAKDHAAMWYSDR